MITIAYDNINDITIPMGEDMANKIEKGAVLVSDSEGKQFIQVTFPAVTPHISSSEKTLLVGGFNDGTGIIIDGKEVRISCNASIKNTGKLGTPDMAAMIAQAVKAALAAK